ncbi:TRAP transporter large permease [Breoghania sp.]|uniref:TRAP transporter large permease n=1 Tax=Breoghania sp. TaxID=2065378 RepID=UPI002AA5E8CF|nr:TRAP transporter large permease [Breoghania sp.]
MTTLFILLGLFALLLAGVPIAFALGGMGLTLLMVGGFSPLMVPQGLLSSVDSFIMLSVPLFILMSNVLLKGGVGKDLFSAVQAWVGHWPGGLAIATILSCGMFAAISGSSVATAATIGTVAIPEMTERGYPRKFVLGLLAAGGTLGILIPPSIPMIVYGVITEESITSLFLAGVMPGLMLMGLFILFAVLYSTYSASYQRSPRADWGTRRRTAIRALPTVLLASYIILGIYRGYFTPTEASAIGLLGALVVTGVVLRTMTIRKLWEAIKQSMVTSVSILVIVAGAKVFGKAITLYRIPQDISMAISHAVDTPGLFILLVAGVLLLMGLFLESLSMMLIMVPVLSGSVMMLGLDPVWFGVFFVLMVECALITPPVGMNIYVIQAVGKADLGEVTIGVLPFLFLMLLSVVAVYFWPDIVLWIPFKM